MKKGLEMKMMLRKLTLLIVLCLLVACSGDKPLTGDEKELVTTEEKTSKENSKEETVLPTEQELGIEHPIRFDYGIKIVSENARLIRKTYELPAKLADDKTMRYGVPLKKGMIEASVENPHDPNGGGPMDHIVTAIGYYDLEKNAFVSVARGEGQHAPLEGDRLLPLDHDRLLYEDYGEDGKRYFIVTIADGSMDEIAFFPFYEGRGYAYTPYTTPDAIYLREAMPDGSTNLNIYDAKTGEKMKTLIGVRAVRPWKDGYICEHMWEDAPAKFSHELSYKEKVYGWYFSKHQSLLEYDVGKDPEEIYAVSLVESTNELDEDLTESDKDEAMGMIHVPLFTLHALDANRTLARMRGTWLNMSVSGPWVALWKTDPDAHEKFFYILQPSKNEAIRVERASHEYGLYLLPYERWGVTAFVSDEATDTYTVHTIEEK